MLTSLSYQLSRCSFLMLFHVLASILAALRDSENVPPKLLLISMDGFRYDLLNKTMVPNIYRWARDGTWFLNGSRSQYATITSPNHMGIVTGLYNENHNIVSNHFWDLTTMKQFDYYNTTGLPGIVNASLDSEFYKVDPIWLQNERNGGKSSVFYWPFAEASFPESPHIASHIRPWKFYGNLTNWVTDIDRIMNEFTRKEEPSNFVAWYIEEPDHFLHSHGFYNGNLKQMMGDLDRLFQGLLNALARNYLLDKVNIILTADHGHAQITDEKHVLCLRDFLPDDTLWGDYAIFTRNQTETEEVYKKLNDAIAKHNFKLKVYVRKDFPERYHYRNSPMTSQIILEPEIGSTAYWCKSSSLKEEYKEGHSTHGQNPDHPEMRALLAMNGPDIVKKQKVEKVPENIDLYPLMCNLLGIKPRPNNGTLDIVGAALRRPKHLTKMNKLF